MYVNAAVRDTCPLSTSTDKKLHILSGPAESDGSEATHLPGGEESMEDGGASPAPGTPKFTPQDESNNNIVVYVSVLAAVVLGLLLYVAYKW